MQQYTTQLPSPALGAMDDLLARREKALALAQGAAAQLAEAASLMPISSFRFASMLRHLTWHDLSVRPEAFCDRLANEARQTFDANGWRWLLDSSGLGDVMTAQDKLKVQRQLDDDPLPLCRENVQSTFVALFETRHEVFRRGVVELFQSLCKRYRSHSAFKVKRRLVVEQAFSEHGGWRSFGSARERVDDLERILLVLEGLEPSQVPHEERLAHRLQEQRHAALMGDGDRAGELETEWLVCRWFANGNLHLWLKRPDHIDRINGLIAEHYGAALAHERY